MTFWTDERKATAERLYREGWSSSQIAREVGAVSRNAVLGMLHKKKVARSRPSEPARPKPRTAWSDMSPPEKLALIRDGLAKGLSAKAIAAGVGASAQVVTSYGNKHGLRFTPADRAAERRTIHAGNIVARLATRAEETPRPMPIAPPAPFASRNVPLLDLKADDCRFMEGDPRAPGAGFCGHPRRFGSPYCAWHHSRCYSAVFDRRAGLADHVQAEAA